MTTLIASPDEIHTLADLFHRLGGISPERVRFQPPPGCATEIDVLDIERREDRLCELLDGVLVEKPMGFRESLLAVQLVAYLNAFVKPRNLGLVSGANGMIRLFPGLIRIPDAAFVSWERIPGRRVPTAPIPQLVPDLAAEVLSASNTAEEMARKRREYFAAGVRLVWEIDPEARTVTVYVAADQPLVLAESEVLDGGNVLPGFQLSLQELFSELDRQASS